MNIKTDVSDQAQHLIVESMPVKGSKKEYWTKNQRDEQREWSWDVKVRIKLF